MHTIDLHLVLFDGVCNLCNASVQFIIRHDKKGKFRFASLQSEFGREQMINYKLDDKSVDSVIYIHNNRAFTQSSAALHIVKHLNGLWPVLYAFKVIPPIIRNMVYRWIANNRYLWFGKKESCIIPTPELKSRFLG